MRLTPLLLLISVAACVSPTESRAQTSTGVILTAEGDSARWWITTPPVTPRFDSLRVFWKKAPTVTAIAVSPKTASVETGKLQGFSALVTWSDGATRPQVVAWSSSGGTITQTGGWTAPLSPGSFLVIPSVAGKADTAKVTVTAPPPTDSCYRRIPVATSAALVAAASSANAGDCILLAAGTYPLTLQTWTRPGTVGKPITLEGVGGATVLTLGGNQAIYVKANYWKIRKLRITNGFFGLHFLGCTGCVADSIEVDHTQNHAVALWYGTNHTTIKNSKIHDSGTSTPKWGEGIYVGGYAAEGSSAPDNLADDNFILNNTFGPNVGAESVDLSDGADRLTVVGNTFDGTGTVSINGQTNSLIGVRGTGHIITDNVLAHGKPYGIDQYNGSATYRRNTITDATVGINVAGGSAVISCDNEATASKVCTP